MLDPAPCNGTNVLLHSMCKLLEEIQPDRCENSAVGQRAKSCCSVSLQRQVRRVVIVCTARTARNRVQADWDPTSLSVQNPKFVFGSPSLPESPYFSWLAALPRAA